MKIALPLVVLLAACALQEEPKAPQKPQPVDTQAYWASRQAEGERRAAQEQAISDAQDPCPVKQDMNAVRITGMYLSCEDRVKLREQAERLRREEQKRDAW